MSDEYTPTTDQVRDAVRPYRVHPKEFDRWLREHDAKVLEDAAQAWLWGGWGSTPRHADRIADRMAASQFAGDWLRARAAALRVGANPKENEHGQPV